ncbi:MAG: hypothetical protein QOJ32_534 [Frankiaceae bacterium]|nr:hypothetical protein [Frankiaceae bacterium]
MSRGRGPVSSSARTPAGMRPSERELSLEVPVCRSGDGAPAPAAAALPSANLSAMAASRSPRRASGARLRSGAGSAARRVLAVFALLPALLLLGAGAASAAGADIGDAHSPDPQSPAMMLALYVGIPAVGFLIAFLLAGRSGRKSDRYRPGQKWEHDPAWFGTTEQGSVEAQDTHRRAALPGSGGVSGRW